MAAEGSLLLEAEMAEEREDAQLSLFVAAKVELPKIDHSKKPFDYTGERLFRDRPDIYDAAVKLLAEPRDGASGISRREICRALHVNSRTLRAVEIREGIPIATQKKGLGDLALMTTEVYFERAYELAPEMTSGKDAMIAAGIAAEKFLLFRGEATAKIDIGFTGNIHDELRRFREDTQALKVIDAEFERIETGLQAENVQQKALEPGDPLACRQPAPSEGESDVLSDVSRTVSEVGRNHAAEFPAESDPGAPPNDDGVESDPAVDGGQGGRGSDADHPPPEINTDKAADSFENKGGLLL